MMGHKEKLITGGEYDVIFARSIYCYLINHSPVHKIKKELSRRNRHKEKQKLKQGIYL